MYVGKNSHCYGKAMGMRGLAMAMA